jgi:D-methionine transport system substrate-binding protein
MIARRGNQDDERMQKLLSLYQSDDTAAFIEKEYEGSLIPVFLKGGFRQIHRILRHCP